VKLSATNHRLTPLLTTCVAATSLLRQRSFNCRQLDAVSSVYLPVANTYTHQQTSYYHNGNFIHI